MTVVSTKEFNMHQEKYFDMAINGNVCIKRGDNMFYLSFAPIKEEYPEQPILEPDERLRNAITIDELLVGVNEDIHNYFTTR
jgi:hypothetical protein